MVSRYHYGIDNSLKHLFNLAFFIGFIAYGFYSMLNSKKISNKENNLQDYDIFSYSCYGLMLFFFCLIGPQILMTLIGIVFLGPFNDNKTKAKFIASDLPFICIRVVTRGTYPQLVRENVVKNIEIVKECGIKQFVVEVVTDQPLNIKKWLNNYVQYFTETLVPVSYKSKWDTRKKARALNYCLENGVNILNKDDYVVHLDEETVLTQDSIKGIVSFIMEGKHMLGQGIITYAMLPSPTASTFTWIQHHICTVADSLRVADDVGKNKAQFQIFHKPYFGMKGSFVVTKYEAERNVTWDFGPEGSVAEDAWFGLAAIDHGYTIDYVEGDMLERSPFTLIDFIKQRQRWMQGLFMVAFLSPMKTKTKMLLIMSVSSWLVSPLYSVIIVLQKFVLLNPPGFIIIIQRFLECYFVYLHIVGYMRQFKFTLNKFLFLVPNILLGCLSNVILENAATIFAIKSLFLGNCYDFHLIQKEVSSDYGIRSKTVTGITNGVTKIVTRYEKER